MNYEVGQVLFLLHAKAMRIITLQVVEQNVKRTKSGEEVSYVVLEAEESSGPTKKMPVQLNTFDGQIFTNPDELSAVMKKNAGLAIDSLVEKSKRLSITFEQQKIKEENLKLLPTNIEQQTIELPDGRIAKVNFSALE